MLHLKTGSGAAAEIRLGDLSLTATWLVKNDEFFVELPPDGCSHDDVLHGMTVRATVAVFLSTGIHTFKAILRRQAQPRLFKVTVVGDVGVTHRRKWVRVPVKLAVSYRLLGEQAVEGRGFATDVSCGGMKLVTEGQLHGGCTLSVAFLEDPWASLGELEAKVVWKRALESGTCYGVAFERLPLAKRDLLTELIAREARRLRESPPRN